MGERVFVCKASRLRKFDTDAYWQLATNFLRNLRHSLALMTDEGNFKSGGRMNKRAVKDLLAVLANPAVTHHPDTAMTPGEIRATAQHGHKLCSFHLLTF